MKDAIIKRLKKVQGISDQWDNIPDYFNERFIQKILSENPGEDKIE